MPHKPQRICSQPGCPALVERGRCTAHQQQTRQAEDRERGSAASRGYDARWRKARAAYLAAHPLCAVCERQDIVRAATVVDHITPHRGDPALFWDAGNWQALCKPCHDAKTSAERHGLRRG